MFRMPKVQIISKVDRLFEEEELTAVASIHREPRGVRALAIS